MPNSNYPWDPYSDQPHVIKDKAFKRTLYKKGALSSLKTLLYAPLTPLFAFRQLFGSKFKSTPNIQNIGLAVNLKESMPGQRDISAQQLVDLVEELGVKKLLIRIPLSDIEDLQRYVDFIQRFSSKEVLVNVLQDRRHIEDEEMLKDSLQAIFSALADQVTLFQIGNSINRKKWGFISTNEYFQFFKVAQTLRDVEFPNLKLLGGNTIDFEVPNFARSVFHGSAIKYDGVAAQLYVDRRGAPENSQFGFDLPAKIQCFYEMTLLSRKSENDFYITETNWPLIGTEPYAPAVGDVMVDEDDQANYLVRYYLLTIATGSVKVCYWHQLVAPGYGLIDNRGDTVRKRKAFYCLRVLCELFNDAEVIRFEQRKTGVYCLEIRNSQGIVRALWTNNSKQSLKLDSVAQLLDATGRELKSNPSATGNVEISGEPVYALNYKLV